MNINNRIEEMYKDLVNIRRDFHMHPELGFEEFRTQEKIIEYLKSYGIDNIQKIAKTGVMAIIEGNKSDIGNIVALRADIDALPITEEFD
ncbi:MAG: amidohydrolase, partial [Clostridiales bacterium]|nr:amidohydrolase [Clostridiales bacterium]